MLTGRKPVSIGLWASLEVPRESLCPSFLQEGWLLEAIRIPCLVASFLHLQNQQCCLSLTTLWSYFPLTPLFCIPLGSRDDAGLLRTVRMIPHLKVLTILTSEKPFLPWKVTYFRFWELGPGRMGETTIWPATILHFLRWVGAHHVQFLHHALCI